MAYLRVISLLLVVSCTASKATKPISLSKGMCLGTCPNFSVTLLPTGVLEFEGKHYTKVVGKASRQLTREEYEKLTRAFNDINFDQLKAVYDGEVLDLPETILTYDNKQIAFKSLGGLPEQLKVFVRMLDSILKKEGLL